MKTNTFSLLASIALLSFASCTDEMQELAAEQTQALKQIVMTTEDFQPEAGSRTIYHIADGAVKCTWAANDTVGVFPDKGAQAYFPMASGAGTKNATFDGEGWALKDGRTYGAYYPFVGAMYLDRNAVPVSYAGQTQVGNASMAHLGATDYMVATPTAPEFGSAQFMFKHLSALVQLKVTVPEPATFTSVKLVTDTKAFAVKGKVDIMADAPVITPVTTSTEVALSLQNVVTTKENEVVTCYLMLPPADLSGKTLKAVLVSDKGNVEVDLESKNFKAGMVYALSGELESTEAGYKNGVVRIAEAGSMKQLLGDNFLNITSLKVVGPINGDDVLCLRQMLGGSEFDDTEKGKLVTLDLSEASIVKGGGKYYKYSGCYTSNDAIGYYMFSDCIYLQNVVLPVGVATIDHCAFYKCSALISVTMGGGVTSIGNSAFNGCSSLISIDIPSGVTSIGYGVFKDCYSLTSINLPVGIASIGNSAFNGCSSLISIGLPAGVASIGEYAFENCSSLISIDIPDGVTSIGVSAFNGCSSLISIDIPDGVTSIGISTFKGCSSLTSVTVGNGVTSIGNSAFYNCSSLISIDIPDGVTSIDASAFNGCSSLISINIPNGVTSIGVSAFNGCSSLISIDIPIGTVSIGESAFSGCSSLTSIVIPVGVTSIGSAAFYNCSSLKSVYITDLSAWCMITFVDYSANPLYYAKKLYLNNQKLTELVIPEGITEIKAHTFRNCSSLTSVDIPAGVTSIGDYAFSGCSSLTSIVIPVGVTSIGNFTFSGCSSLTSINIPASVTSIGGSAAFYNCSSLKSVHITDLSAWCKITFSGDSSNPLYYAEKLYLNNEELTEVTIPADVKQIKDYAFYGYKNLKKVIMSDGVASVGKSAFYGCSSLASVNFSTGITSVGIHSFRDCSSLTQVYCYGTTPPTINPSSTNSSFNGSKDGRTLYVPKGYLSAYQASSWADFFGTITEMD